MRVYRWFLILVFCDESFSWTNGTDEQMSLKKIVAEQCSSRYSINCFLMDVCKLLDKSRSTNSYQILPGVYVIKDNISLEDTSIDMVQQAVIDNQTDLLDLYVQKKLNSYLDSLSLSIKIMDRNSAVSVRKISDNFITDLIPKINSGTGRGKKKGSKDSAVWAAGAIAALGSSALFAMSGKAILASMAALLLSMMCYFKGHGHSSHYTATTGAIAAPYRHQCAEAIIDVNAKDYNSALIGYKKRTLDDAWNYPRYAAAPVTNDPSYTSHNNQQYPNWWNGHFSKTLGQVYWKNEDEDVNMYKLSNASFPYHNGTMKP